METIVIPAGIASRTNKMEVVLGWYIDESPEIITLHKQPDDRT